MEKIRDIFRKLFSVEIPHEGNAVERDWIRIEPAPETQQILGQNKLLFKNYTGGFMIAAKTQNAPGQENKPLYALEGVELVFRMAFADKVVASETALPLKDGKKYIFSNKTAFDAGINSASLALKPVNAPATIAGEIVKDAAKLKLAGIDYSSATNPPPLTLKEIADGEYATTSNLDNVSNPLLAGLTKEHFGVIHILIGKQAVLGNKYKLLLASDEVSPKDFEIRVMKMI